MNKNKKLVVALLLSTIVVSCSKPNPSGSVSLNPDGTTLSETVLKEHGLYEDVAFEDNRIEEQIYELYLEEKLFFESSMKEVLLEESIIKEIIALETFYIPPDDPYKNYDGAAGASLFGDRLNLNDLIIKGAIGAGCILIVAVVSVLPFSSPISVAFITVAKNALPHMIKGATVGTLVGAGLGAASGVGSLDESGRTEVLINLALASVFFLIALLSPVAKGAAIFTTILHVSAIVASFAGLVAAGVQTIKVFKQTDGFDMELEDLNWEKLGYSIAERAIEGAVNGFMVGAVAGALTGVSKSFVKVDGKTVLIDNSTFNPNHLDGNGRTNIERMEQGLAPIGYDGESVNLHHLDQTDNGMIVELQRTVHTSNSLKIHMNTGQHPSLIDRDVFRSWRLNYWKWRATYFK